MNQDGQNRKGVIEGGTRVLKELMGSPRFRQSLRILLNELDPENTPELVRTLMEQDPETPLGILGSAPKFANTAILGANELMQKLSEFTPELLGSFSAELLNEIQAEKLGEALGLLTVLLFRSGGQENGSLETSVSELGQGIARGFNETLTSQGIPRAELSEHLVKAIVSGMDSMARRLSEDAKVEDAPTMKAVDNLTQGIKGIARRNPDLITRVVRPLVQAGKEAFAEEDTEDGGDD